MNPDDALAGGGAPALDRRDLLKKAGVAGAIVWTSPIILSHTAASAGTCLPGSVEWAAGTTPIDIGNLTTTPFSIGLAASHQLDVSLDQTGIGGGSVTTAEGSPSPLGGVASSYLTMELSALNSGDFVELTLQFDANVSGLTFTLLDIDRATGSWQDEVTLTATDLASTAVTLGTSFTIVNTTNVGHTSTATTDTFTALIDPGGPGVDNTSNQGNVTVTYPAPVSTVVIRYAAGPDEFQLQPQQIGISDLDFCLWP